MNVIHIIKNQYFSDENSSYILNFINNSINKTQLFHLQNDVYNLFIDSVHKNTIIIDSENIEEILIS
jgi:hypothetical protein